eukprot:UN17235
MMMRAALHNQNNLKAMARKFWRPFLNQVEDVIKKDKKQVNLINWLILEPLEFISQLDR